MPYLCMIVRRFDHCSLAFHHRNKCMLGQPPSSPKQKSASTQNSRAENFASSQTPSNPLPDYFIRIPLPLLRQVMTYLNLQSLGYLSSVSRFFKEHLQENYIW